MCVCADLPRPLSRPQEHWTERSKGLLQDFAKGLWGVATGPGPGATAPPPPSTHRRARTMATMNSLEVGGAAGRSFRMGGGLAEILVHVCLPSRHDGEPRLRRVCAPDRQRWTVHRGLPPLPAPGSSSSPCMQRPSINVDPQSVSHSGCAGPLLVPVATHAHSPVFPHSASNSGSHHLKT